MVAKFSRGLFIGFITLAVVAGLFLAGNYIKVPYTGMVTYYEDVPKTKTQTFKDREPYTDKECHMEDVRYSSSWKDSTSSCLQEECAEKHQVCVETNFWGNCLQFEDRCARNQCIKGSLTCALDIKNLDTEGGTFTVKGYVIDENREELFVEDVKVYVAAMSTGTAEWTYIFYPPQRFGCSVKDIDLPSKQVCDNVIKYRDVEKQQQVVVTEKVKKETEQVKYHSLFEHWGLK